MTTVLALLGMLVAGILVSLQSPINTALAKNIGSFPSVFVSFVVGTAISGVIVAVLRNGDLVGVVRAPSWQLLGGAFGTAFVAALVITLPLIGVTRAVLAGLLGQILAALAVDQFGWFGVDPRPLTPTRFGGVLLVAAGLYLVNRT